MRQNKNISEVKDLKHKHNLTDEQLVMANNLALDAFELTPALRPSVQSIKNIVKTRFRLNGQLN